MPLVTTSTLVDRAKAASDMRDNFVTPAQWMLWATQERYGLELFVARAGWAMNISNFDFTVTGAEAGVFPITSVPGIMAIVAVHEYTTTGVRQLKYQDAITFLHQLPGNTTNTRGHSIAFRALWTGDNVSMNLYPEPNTGESYRVTFLVHPKPLALSTTTGYDTSVTYPMGWEERIVLGMARRALIKEESETRAIDSEIQLWESRIEETCWSRVLSESPSVRNVDQNEYGWTDRLNYPPPMGWVWL